MANPDTTAAIATAAPSKRKVGRPSEADGIDKAYILKVALKEFATHGYNGTSVTAIAKIVNVKDSLLHYHFGSKDGLWKAAIARAANTYHEESQKTARYFKGLDVRSMTQALIRQLIYFAAENIELYQVIYHEMMHHSVRADWLTDNVIQPFSEKTEWLFKVWQQQEGRAIEMPVSHFISLSYGLYSTFFIMQHPMKKLYDVDVFDKTQVESHADMLTEILLQTVFKEPPIHELNT